MSLVSSRPRVSAAAIEASPRTLDAVSARKEPKALLMFAAARTSSAQHVYKVRGELWRVVSAGNALPTATARTALIVRTRRRREVILCSARLTGSVADLYLEDSCFQIKRVWEPRSKVRNKCESFPCPEQGHIFGIRGRRAARELCSRIGSGACFKTGRLARSFNHYHPRLTDPAAQNGQAYVSTTT